MLRIPMAGRIGAGIVIQPPDSDFDLFLPKKVIEVARSMLSEQGRRCQPVRPGS